MSTTTVQCPSCGSDIDLDEALIRQLTAPMRAAWEADLRQQIRGQVQAAFVRDLDEQVAQRRTLEGQLAERELEIKNLRQQETALLRARRELEDQKENLERATEQMRDEIRSQERAAADQRAGQRADDDLRRKDAAYQEQLRRLQEQHGIQTRQLEDQLTRVRCQLEEAQRKTSTSPRQQEGVTRQDMFGDELRHRYPDDLITVTPQGRRGPDITQVVRVGRMDCGIILWECKRTAAWGAAWPAKLAAEVLQAKARFGVIVSEVMPIGMDGSGRIGDLWACSYDHAGDLAAGLREAIIAVRRHETANAGRQEIAGKIYDYVATGPFEGRYKSMEQAIDKLRQEIEQDQRASQQRWKRLQHLVDRIRDDGLHGILLDIIGLGGEIPPAARAELPHDNPPELPAA